MPFVQSRIYLQLAARLGSTKQHTWAAFADLASAADTATPATVMPKSSVFFLRPCHQQTKGFRVCRDFDDVLAKPEICVRE